MIDSPEKKELLRRMRKKVTGSDFATPRCALCHREFTEDELLKQSFIFSVGHAGGVQFCPACFKKEFFRGGD